MEAKEVARSWRTEPQPLRNQSYRVQKSSGSRKLEIE
jgi:hypothetical protein